MHRLKHALLDWLPVALWMALIYAGSSDLLSSPNTSRFLGPLLYWLFPTMDPETLKAIQFAVRKCGHVAEYAILAALLWRAIAHLRDRRSLTWHRADAGWAVLICVVYAATDEWHQSLVPSRYGTAWDVLWDGLGAATGLLVLRWIGRRRQWF